MSDYLTIARAITLVLTLASIFAIFMVTILKVIRRAEFFSGKSSALVAVSLSILFLVALSQFLIGPGETLHSRESDGTSQTMSYAMLPGVALGVAAAVVLSQVLLLANKQSGKKSETLANKAEIKKSERPAKAKSPGRPKKKEQKSSPALKKTVEKQKDETEVNATTRGTAKS